MSRNIISKRKKQVWIKIKGQYRPRTARDDSNTFRRLEEANRRLLSRLNYMVSKARPLDAIKLRYLALRDKVADTEQLLLLNGIDTSEYPLFCELITKIEEDRDSDCEIIDDIKSEVLSDCEMNAENFIPIDGQDFNMYYLKTLN